MVKNLIARHSESAGGVVIGLSDTDDVREGQAEGEPVDLILPDQETIGTFLCPCTVCLIKNAPHPAAAQKLVEYLVSPEVETVLCGSNSGYTPVRAGATDGGDGDAIAAAPPAQGHQWFDISDQQLLENLEPSSRWTLEHFHR